MSIYANIGGAQKTLSALYANVDGAQKQLSSMLANVSGTSKEILKPPGTPISSMALGSIVKIPESGVAQDYYVAKHNYENTGNTLLVRRYIFSTSKWNTNGDGKNTYAYSTIEYYIHGSDYFYKLPYPFRDNVIPEISIPYTPGNGNNTVTTLTARKLFLLSVTELGKSATGANVEGTALSIASTLQIATNSSGTAMEQWTRTPYTGNTDNAFWYGGGGNPNQSPITNTLGVRPAFTLPATTLVDASNNIITS